MSLKSQPEFETETETTTATATSTKEKKMNTTVPATQQANTAVGATRASTGVPFAFGDKKDVIDTDTVAALSQATPRITGEQGSLYLDRKDDLGDAVRIQVVSFNHRWLCTTGTDDKEAKDYLRTSYDNQTVYGEGITVAAYMEALRAKGYPGKVAPYTDMFGFLVWTKAKGEIPVEQRALTLVQLSKTSAAAWASFCVSRGFMELAGAQKLEIVEIRAEKRESNGNRYTNMSFHAPTAA